MKTNVKTNGIPQARTRGEPMDREGGTKMTKLTKLTKLTTTKQTATVALSKTLRNAASHPYVSAMQQHAERLRIEDDPTRRAPVPLVDLAAQLRHDIVWRLAAGSLPATSLHAAAGPPSGRIQVPQPKVWHASLHSLPRTSHEPRVSFARRAWWISLVVLAMSIGGVAHAEDHERATHRGVDEEEEDDDDRTHVDVDVDTRANPGVEPLGGGSRTPRAPAIADVLEAAYGAAGLAHDPTKLWSGRARVAGLVPWVTVRVGWDQSWRDDEPEVGRGRDFEVRATWRLDRVLFDGRELQVSSIDTARRRERRRLASRVIRAYFGWRRVTAAAVREPRFGLAAEAATAELDALTDGWFSRRAESAK